MLIIALFNVFLLHSFVCLFDQWKFLAAEALRGCGGLLLDRDGQRFCDEMGRRDYVSGKMNDRNKFPYRLLLNSAMAREFDWHCKVSVWIIKWHQN